MANWLDPFNEGKDKKKEKPLDWKTIGTDGSTEFYNAENYHASGLKLPDVRTPNLSASSTASFSARKALNNKSVTEGVEQPSLSAPVMPNSGVEYWEKGMPKTASNQNKDGESQVDFGKLFSDIVSQSKSSVFKNVTGSLLDRIGMQINQNTQRQLEDVRAVNDKIKEKGGTVNPKFEVPENYQDGLGKHLGGIADYNYAKGEKYNRIKEENPEWYNQTLGAADSIAMMAGNVALGYAAGIPTPEMGANSLVGNALLKATASMPPAVLMGLESGQVSYNDMIKQRTATQKMLDDALKSGEITKEQYDEAAKNYMYSDDEIGFRATTSGAIETLSEYLLGGKQLKAIALGRWKDILAKEGEEVAEKYMAKTFGDKIWHILKKEFIPEIAQEEATDVAHMLTDATTNAVMGRGFDNDLQGTKWDNLKQAGWTAYGTALMVGTGQAGGALANKISGPKTIADIPGLGQAEVLQDNGNSVVIQDESGQVGEVRKTFLQNAEVQEVNVNPAQNIQEEAQPQAVEQDKVKEVVQNMYNAKNEHEAGKIESKDYLDTIAKENNTVDTEQEAAVNVKDEVIFKDNKGRINGGTITKDHSNGLYEVETEGNNGKEYSLVRHNGKEFESVYSSPTSTEQVPMEDRTFENVGNRKVKSYQYLHPELKSFIQDEATVLWGELEATMPAQRSAVLGKDGEYVGSGNKRYAHQSIVAIKNLGATYEEIRKAIESIVKDHGAENYALAKKIEIIINDRLTDGYNFMGEEIGANKDYIDTKNKIEKVNTLKNALKPHEAVKTSKGTNTQQTQNKGITEALTSEEGQATLNKIKQDMKNQGIDADFEVIKGGTAFHKDIQKVMKSLGVEVVFYKGDKVPNGFISNSVKNTIFIHSSGERNDMVATTGHEFLHHVKKTYANEYKELLNFAKTYFTKEAREKFLKTYSNVPELMDSLSNNENDLLEEMLADEMGNNFMDKNFWQRVYEHSKELFEKLVEVAQKIVKAFTEEDMVVTYVAKETAETLSKKFEETIASVRKQVAEGKIDTEAKILEDNGIQLSKEKDSLAPISYNVRTYTSEAKKKIVELAEKNHIAEAEETYQYLKALDNVMATIIADADRLDYEESNVYKALKNNSDPHYKESVDFTTLCRKRIILQGTIEKIQSMLGRGLTQDEWIDTRRELNSQGIEVSCGACYVDTRRMEMGLRANQYIEKNINQKQWYAHDKIKKNVPYPEKLPPKSWFYTQEGLDKMKEEYPEIYTDFNSKTGARGIKAPESRTAYRGEVLNMLQARVDALNSKAGLRWQSWSDFEVPHLLDGMQVITDMFAKGLKGHAYTKVENFVRAFGKTGMMINMSLIPKGKGLDADGNLSFDSKEGMPFETTLKYREDYPSNVGNVTIGVNDDFIRAAMRSSEIDYIIPYHKSGLSLAKRTALGIGMEEWSDYERVQNPIPRNKEAKANAKKLPDIYDVWDYNKTPKENADAYIEELDKLNYNPPFPQFTNEENYWKVLIDHKMVNQLTGENIIQQAVKPEFDEDVLQNILSEYKGEHNEGQYHSPTVDKLVEQFSKRTRSTTNSKLTMKDATKNDTKLSTREKILYHGTPNNELTKPTTSRYGKSVIFLSEHREVAENYIGLNGKVIPLNLSKEANIVDATGNEYNDDWHTPDEDTWQKLYKLSQKMGVDLGHNEYEYSLKQPLTYEAMVTTGFGGLSSGFSNFEIVDVFKAAGIDGVNIYESANNVENDGKLKKKKQSLSSVQNENGLVKSTVILNPDVLKENKASEYLKPAMKAASEAKNTQGHGMKLSTRSKEFKVTSSMDYIKDEMLKPDTVIKVHGYRGRAKEDGYSNAARYGKAKYYSNMYGVAETWMKSRGDGATIEEKKIELKKPFVDSYDVQLSKIDKENLYSELKNIGLTETQINVAFDSERSWNRGKWNSPFEALAGLYKRNGNDDGNFYSGATAISDVLKKLGFDGVVGELRSEGTLEFAVFPQEETKFSTRSKEFKQWFGDSKVTDEEGNPKVVYHGTTASEDFNTFLTFNENEPGAHFGSAEAANTFGDRVYPVYLSIQNPLEVDDIFSSATSVYRGLKDIVFNGKLPKNEAWNSITDLHEESRQITRKSGRESAKENNEKLMKAMVDYVKASGYDGFKYQNEVEDENSASWVVFESNQVKSAIGNNGEYSNDKVDIRESVREKERRHYSKQYNGSDAMDDEVFKRISDSAKFVDERMSIKSVAEEADKRVKADPQKYIDKIRDSASFASPEDVAEAEIVLLMVQKAAQEYDAQGDKTRAEQKYNLAASIASKIITHFTNTARTLNMGKLWRMLDSNGVIRVAENIIEKSSTDDEKRKVSKEAKELLKAIGELDDAGLKHVKEALGFDADSPVTAEEVLEEAEYARDSNFNEVDERVKEVAEIFDAIEKKNARKIADTVKKSIKSVLEGIDFGIKFMARGLELNPSESINDKIARLTEEYYSKPLSERGNLARILAKELNITMAQADTIATRINDKMKEVTKEEKIKALKGEENSEAKRNAIEKWLTPKMRKDPVIKSWIDRIVELSESGALTNEDLKPLVAAKYGIKVMTPEISRTLDEMAKEIKALTRGSREYNIKVNALNDYLNSLTGHDFWEYLNAYEKLSLLSGSRSGVRNTTGNLRRSIDYNVEKFEAALMDLLQTKFRQHVLGQKDAKRSILMPRVGKQIAAGLKGQKNEFKDVLRLKEVNSRPVEDSREYASYVKFKNPVLQVWQRWVRLLVSDRAFTESVIADAMYDAKKLAEINGLEFDEDIAMMEAQKIANETFFNGDDEVIKRLMNIRREGNFGKSRAWGIGTGLMAFLKVPYNVSKFAIEREWHIALSKIVVKSVRTGYLKAKGKSSGSTSYMKEGNFDTRAFLTDIAKLGNGATIMFVGTWLYAMGMVRMRPDDDDKDKKLLALEKILGKGKYQLNLSAVRRFFQEGGKQIEKPTDEYASLDWFAPVSILMIAGIKSQQVSKESKAQKSYEGLPWYQKLVAYMEAQGTGLFEGVSEQLNTVLELPMMQTLNSFKYAEDASDYIGIFLSGLPNRLLAPAPLKYAKELSDEYARDTYTDEGLLSKTVKNVQVKLPVVSKGLYPKVDMFGNDVKQYPTGNSVGNVFFNPAYMNTYTTDPEALKLEEIYNRFKTKDHLPPATRKTWTIKKKDYPLLDKDEYNVVLTPEEYYNYQVAYGKKVKEIVRDNLEVSDDKDMQAVIDKRVADKYDKARQQVEKEILRARGLVN